MTMDDFMASILGMPGKFIDDICDNFDLDIEEEEVYEILNELSGDYRHKSDYYQFGNAIIRLLYTKVIDNYSDQLEADKFDYYIGGVGSSLTYDGEEVNSDADLQAIIDRMDEEDGDEEETFMLPYSTEDGDFDMELTRQDIKDCSHAGNCDDDCERVAAKDYIQKQLQDVPTEAIVTALVQSGVEIEDETDRKELYELIVWNTACYLKEDIRAKEMGI